MIRVRLKMIIEADFRKSEVTNFKSLVPKKVRQSLGKFDAVCLISKSGNQMCFVYAQRNEVTQSLRVRLSKGTWNPLMLANYAADAGLELVGLRRFEEYYREL